MSGSFLKIDLKKAPNKRERIIFFAALGVFCFGFAKTCVYGGHQALVEVENQIKTLEQEKQKLAQPQAAEAPAPETQKKEKTWTGSTEAFSGAVEAIMQPMHQKGVRILKSQFSELKKEDSLLYRDVSVQFTGSYAAIGRYIEYLEAMAVPLVIKNLSMQVDENRAIVVEISGGVYGIN